MKHINDGTLRRMIDEPISVGRREREHYGACTACRDRLTEIEATRRITSSVLDRNVPDTDLATARNRLRSPAGRPNHGQFPWGWLTPLRFVSRGRAPSLAGVLAAIIIAAFAFSPARLLGQDFLTIFQPRQFVPIPITTAELRTLPNLQRFGSLRMSPSGTGSRYTSKTAAEARLGSHIALPTWVPAGTPSGMAFQVMPAQQSSFTFRAWRAAAWARRHHRRLPAMPASIDGSTIRLSVHGAALTVYGRSHSIPALVVGQTAAPQLGSTGASLKVIERYLLSLPGISKTLATEIESIGNPQQTLPIPVPVNWAFAQHVQVQGKPGLLVGDDTGIVSAVLWESHHVIFGVGGSVTASQILQIADSVR